MLDRRRTYTNLDFRLKVMRQRAITISGAWFLWINLLFCLFILGRHYFSPIKQIASITQSYPVREVLMGLILAITSFLMPNRQSHLTSQCAWVSRPGRQIFLLRG